MASPKITRICRICGSQFRPLTYRQRLCSQKCRVSTRIKQITLVCRECGKEYTREPNQVRSGRKYFCSRECSSQHGQPFEKKFWAKVEKTENCWLWRGTLSNKGYGVTRFNKRRMLAHRVSFEIHHFPIPKGLEVLHLCDTPACVNPEHLETGTHSANMADCARKKHNCFGERQGSAKLTDKKVREARHLRFQGFTYLEISKHFNVTRHAISCAIRGKTWKHVS